MCRLHRVQTSDVGTLAPIVEKLIIYMCSNNEIWVFLSHSHKDYEKVRKVRDMLEDQHMRPLMFFLKCLNDYDEIDSLIKREIDCRTRFILCDSDNARKSDWVKEEVEYIKSQDRIYETIDLDMPIEEIKEKLLDFKRRATLFISYNRENQNLAKSVYERLCKYDFHVFMDMMSLLDGNFQAQIYSSLDKAVKKGYVVAIIGNQILYPDSFLRHELIRAINSDKIPGKQSILPFVTEESLVSAIERDADLNVLSDYDIQDISGFPSDIRCDKVVNSVLTKMLTPGTILTHAHNFKNGVNCEKDIEEADKLYSLYFQLADEATNLQSKNNTDSALKALGKCYEMGWGTPIDLQMALNVYRDTVGCRSDAERVILKIQGKWNDDMSSMSQLKTEKKSFF